MLWFLINLIHKSVIIDLFLKPWIPSAEQSIFTAIGLPTINLKMFAVVFIYRGVHLLLLSVRWRPELRTLTKSLLLKKMSKNIRVFIIRIWKQHNPTEITTFDMLLMYEEVSLYLNHMFLVWWVFQVI